MKIGKKGLVGLIIAILLIASLVLVVLPKAEIKVSKLVISPKEVLVGEPVAISADIENSGRASADYQATLAINSNVQETRTVKVPAGSVQNVSFIFTPTSTGEYKVALGGLTGVFVAREGALPILYQGDQWVYKVSRGGERSEVTYKVLGETTIEGNVVYVVESTGRLVPEPFDKGISYIDKGTLYALLEEKSGTVGYVPVSERVTVGNQQIQGSVFPLEAGKQWSVSWTAEVESKEGLVLRVERKQVYHSFKVEGVEAVTTAAGTFRCFKVVEQDERGITVRTSWYSDKVRREAKYEIVVQGVPAVYELSSYQVSTAPPAIPPAKLDSPSVTRYSEPTFAYVISYPGGWELVSRGGEEGAVEVFTSGGASGIPYAYLGVKALSIKGTAILDELYKAIMENTEKGDPNFELVNSIKVPAELPWYEIQWNSSVKGVKTTGKTVLALKGQQLFIVTGWVQKAYAEDYWSALDKVMDSFGIYP